MTLGLAFLIGGGLLLLAGLAHQLLSRLPITPPMLYLGVGLILGPAGLALVHLNPLQHASSLELLTEVAVLLSLFTAGVRMPVPITWARWRAPMRLAFIGMGVTVLLMAGFGHYYLSLSWGAAILLAAILAPTDPVLATDVQVRHPGDRDRLRFGLTSEGGLNDGSAFPFVMLGLGLLGLDSYSGMGSWLLWDVLWATVGGIFIGWICGGSLALATWSLRQRQPSMTAYDDMLGLGLIGASYGLALLTQTWGFLAVFVAALALRHHEYRLARLPPERLGLQGEATARSPAPITHASLAFKQKLERLGEIGLIVLVGCTLFTDSWSGRALLTALFLFFVARPIAVYIALWGLKLPPRVRGLTAWFGVRGIGSLYYLSYAIHHGLDDDLALELLHITLAVVTLSIVIHGCSIRPLLSRFGQVRPKPQRERSLPSHSTQAV